MVYQRQNFDTNTYHRFVTTTIPLFTEIPVNRGPRKLETYIWEAKFWGENSYMQHRSVR